MRRMRTAAAVIGLWAVALAGGPVAAADVSPLPSKSPPYVAPLYDWTGLYLGGHGGAGWSSATVRDPTGVTFAPPGTGVSISGDGWLGGVQLGYNHQLGAWVFGIEGDLSYTDIRGSTTSPFGVDISNRLNWVATVSGRLGIAWDRTLLYAKAGAAFAENSYSGLRRLTCRGSRSSWSCRSTGRST